MHNCEDGVVWSEAATKVRWMKMAGDGEGVVLA
jgi:hypothetical protein